MNTITRRSLLGSMVRCSPLLALAPRLLAQSTANPVDKKMNILLIVADDMGWADIGYHNPELRTPVLDELARTGVELDCHYVQPQCTPTRVALMTGRYPSRFGSHCTQASNERAYPRGTLTLASMLKSRGYETALTGKWHMGSTARTQRYPTGRVRAANRQCSMHSPIDVSGGCAGCPPWWHAAHPNSGTSRTREE